MTFTTHSQPSITKLKRQVTKAWLENAPLREAFIALNALHNHDSELVSGDHLAIAVKRLLRAEQHPGGPYSDAADDLDLLTNAAIAHFADWAAGPLTPTISYINKRLADNPCVSKLVYHQLGGITELRANLSVAVNCSDEQLGEVGRLAADVYAHSLVKSGAERSIEAQYERLDAEIFARVQGELDVYGEDIARLGKLMLTKVRKANKNFEITLLSTYFADSLTYPVDLSSITGQLGVANLYCWIAYMLYDSMLDEQRDTHMLPLANIAHRKSLELYRSACLDPNMRNFVDYAFDEMDATNAWEETHARHKPAGTIPKQLPMFGNLCRLAHRSYAHILGPLIIASRVPDISSDGKQSLHDSLIQYLIARQLNDDTHDWQEDLRDGHITYVVIALVKQVYGRKLPDGVVDTQALQQAFWKHTGEDMSEQIQEHIAKARKLLETSMIVDKDSRFMYLYDVIDKSARQSRALKRRGTTFIKQVSKEPL